MGKIIRYEIMERGTYERLMFDMEALLKSEGNWEPVGGVVVAHHLEESRVANRPPLLKRRYLQAVILYK